MLAAVSSDRYPVCRAYLPELAADILTYGYMFFPLLSFLLSFVSIPSFFSSLLLFVLLSQVSDIRY
jgi:hypothetical protein